jgi:hypothetical protein
LIWKKYSSELVTWKSLRALGPPITITKKSLPSYRYLLPTGGLSSSRCSRAHSMTLTGIATVVAVVIAVFLSQAR